MTDAAWLAPVGGAVWSPRSAVTEQVWREAMGPEYPDGLDVYSWTSRTELEQIRGVLLHEGVGRVADLGCGSGGPGLWLSASVGADLVAVDADTTALHLAKGRAETAHRRTACLAGSFEAIPLQSNSVDAVVSIDALLFAQDKALAAAEIARVLRPGGCLVLTSWDYARQPAGRPPQVEDHRPVLESAGLTVERYDETPDWRARQETTARLLLERVDDLALEGRRDAQRLREDITTMARSFDDQSGRFLAVARRASTEADPRRC
ncbi:class I SAM-dependent methyltransferase [Luteipulveratus mongoliensis]|uniref:Methyltransferase type 11 domain-containing protein n=1 Tax=Luteipulveratus mongoliensis TaxID=571913 RepID=A0A0K1JND5_9MICO|nr:class I SAM-dependent methyltransferase [Luteipulveratus mongoliensis]AKU18113.1 hypothetical protein VV02_23350 [Luteipulveratus mongoliensis]